MSKPHVVISAGQVGSLRHMLECARMVTVRDQIAIVASAHGATAARAEVGRHERVELVIGLRERRNPDLLLPLARAFARSPLSTIVFAPSAFSIADPHVLAGAIARAVKRPDRITAIGWAQSAPDAAVDADSFVLVGAVTSFWELLRRARPRHAAILECYVEAIGTSDEYAMLLRAYEHLEAIDLFGILAPDVPVEMVEIPASAIRCDEVTADNVVPLLALPG
jgi:hypothetical protein